LSIWGGGCTGKMRVYLAAPSRNTFQVTRKISLRC
jgi:hypothetical protein